MDHPCHKCGQNVEDGKAFCSQCGAPQIRVAVAESIVPIAGSVAASDSMVLAMDPPGVPRSLSAASLLTGIEWRQAFRICAIAALISALVMSFGLMVPVLAGLGAGFLAVTLYHRRNPSWRPTARSGAQLGAVGGVLFFGISAILEALSTVLFHSGGQARQKMVEALQQAASRSSDPQMQAAFDRLRTPEGLAVVFVLFMLALLVVSIAAGSLAGASAAAFLGRRNRL